MADADPNPLPNDGGDPSNKRKKTATNLQTSSGAGSSPSLPSKHPDESSASNDVEIDDTATSKKLKKEEIEVIEIKNIDIMREILSYQNRTGKNPCYTPELQNFCHLYTYRGVGNASTWIEKMKEMKNKFNDDSAPIEDDDKKEFEMWKKIWGNESKRDDDPGVGSSK